MILENSSSVCLPHIEVVASILTEAPLILTKTCLEEVDVTGILLVATVLLSERKSTTNPREKEKKIRIVQSMIGEEE